MDKNFKPNTNIENIMFLDIETVPQTEFLDDLSHEMKLLWLLKFENIKNNSTKNIENNQSDNENYFNNAGIYSEFSKIICISIGFFHNADNQQYIRIKSFYGNDESRILNDFSNTIQKFFKNGDSEICGHNIKEFDIPFICRRMLINNIVIPKYINVAGKKPWEVPFIDTLELWRFGDRKAYTSLKLLTTILGIPTPKDEIDGSMVAEYYYKKKNIELIAKYCQKDVLATARLYQKFCNIEPIPDSSVIIV